MSEIFLLCLKLAFGIFVSFFATVVCLSFCLSFIYHFCYDFFEKYCWQIWLFFIIYFVLLIYYWFTANENVFFITLISPLLIKIIFDSIKSNFTKFFKKTNNNN